MSSLLTISANLDGLDKIIDGVGKMNKGGDGLRFTKEAIEASLTDVVQRTWLEYASGAQVHYSGGTFTIHVVTGDYLRSIQDGLVMIDSLTGEIVSTCPYASVIEEGQPPRDMKNALLSGGKAKTGKNGKKYVTIPFRHGVPGTSTLDAMPQHIYNQVKNFSFSRRNSFLQKATSFLVSGKSSGYKWGDRLGQSDEGGRSHSGSHPGAGYSHKTGKYSGMVKTGSSGQTSYLTFRRLSENSDPRSWRHPGVKGRPIRTAVVENTQDEVVALIRRGFEMDLYFLTTEGV